MSKRLSISLKSGSCSRVIGLNMLISSPAQLSWASDSERPPELMVSVTFMIKPQQDE
jgi:hypothetical protein